MFLNKQCLFYRAKTICLGAPFLKSYTISDEVLFTVAIHHHTQYSVTRNTGIQISPGLKYKIGVRAVEVGEIDFQ